MTEHPYDTVAVAQWSERLLDNPKKLSNAERRELARDLIEAVQEIDRLTGKDEA